MKVLLDTHILIWAITDNENLSEEARNIILDPANEICYSAVSVWEVVIKHMKSPDIIPISGWELVGFCLDAGFSHVPVTDKHALMVETLHRDKKAKDHKDPFDRMLISQSKVDNMLFVTHDATLSQYQEECVRIV